VHFIAALRAEPPISARLRRGERIESHQAALSQDQRTPLRWNSGVPCSPFETPNWHVPPDSPCSERLCSGHQVVKALSLCSLQRYRLISTQTSPTWRCSKPAPPRDRRQYWEPLRRLCPPHVMGKRRGLHQGPRDERCLDVNGRHPVDAIGLYGPCRPRRL